MNKVLLSMAVIVLSGALGVGTASAQDDEGPPNFSPLELFVCSYRDGQDQGDFDNAMDEMRDWMEENDGAPYSAWRLNPFITGGNFDADFIYLGSWPDGSTMGKDNAAYFATGADAIEAWDEAVECGVSVMYASHNVKEPPPNVDAGEFVLTVSDCKVAEGRKTGDAIAAMRSWGDYRAANGSLGGQWLWFPAYGGGAVDYTFKLVYGFSGLESFGNYWSWYVDNQGYLTWGDMTGGLVSCDVDRAYIGDTLINGLSTVE
jgi:hypothetical protein